MSKLADRPSIDSGNFSCGDRSLYIQVIAEIDTWYWRDCCMPILALLAGPRLINGFRVPERLKLFLSLTNLFHAHALPRALTTSTETALTVLALHYWPFDRRQGNSTDNLSLALVVAAVTFVLRPTNIVLWIVLGGYHLTSQVRYELAAASRTFSSATTIGYVYISEIMSHLADRLSSH